MKIVASERLADVTNALRSNNRDIRGGPLVLGRREYRVRTVSRSQDIEELGNFLLRRDASGSVYIRDVAQVEMGRKFQDSAFLFNDSPAAAVGVIRRVGANVPTVAAGVRATLDRLQAQFDRENQGVELKIAYDESTYVEQSVSNVQSSLLMGSLLAIAVLILFLGSLRTVVVIAISIPTAIIGVFIASALLGRSLNIISLAALGFSSGMVVDNAIVVVENIFSHLQRGASRLQAAITGTTEVSGAILAATLTNIAVFTPLVLVTGEVARLFFDMAITITAASILSLFVALTLVPMLAGLMLNPAKAQGFQADTGEPIVARTWLAQGVAQASAVFRQLQGRLERGLLNTVRWSLGPRQLKRRLALLVEGKEELDVTVQLQDTFVKTPEQLRQLSLYSPSAPSGTVEGEDAAAPPGQQIQVADVATVVETTGPDAINHVDLERSITLTATLAPDAPLGKLVNQTENQVLEPLRATLPSEVRLELFGSDDRLAETVSQLASAFVFSVVITYLLLIALYRSFLYPLVIMTTVPMGMTGALLSLVLVNWIPGVIVLLDMITGLGFLILTGVVVNNSILIVERALQLQAEGQKYDESLYNATRDRLRPIFMAAGTSILGMLPLALFPGQGSELYQGLGIALVGGLTLSTILTPTVVPALMALLRDFD